MNKLQVLIVEDNLSFSLEVEMLIAESGYNLMKSVDNAAKALTLITNSKPDLILLDIGIKGSMNGLELAEIIAELKIPIIFMTQSRDDETYARAQKTNPIAYLVKPFDLLTLQSTIVNVFRKSASTNAADSDLIIPAESLNKGAFFIKNNNKLTKLTTTEIDWVQSDGNYCYIHSNEKKYVLKISLSNLLKKLEPFNFIRIHKSYVLPLQKIDNIDLFESMVNSAGKSFPLGRRYKPALVKRLEFL